MNDSVTDVLGAPYTAETIEFPADAEGAVVATLVKRPADSPTNRAVLHVHGFADYFFQTEYAEWWNARGYDFYALDLRKYGRSIRDHQTANYIDRPRGVLPRPGRRLEPDHRPRRPRPGGLQRPLDRRPDRRPVGRRAAPAGAGRHGPQLAVVRPARARSSLRTAGTAVLNRFGARQPMRAIPRNVSGLYTRSLHRDHDGEWDFNLAWKPIKSWPIYVGWLRAIRIGHARLHAGLDVRCPALVLCSDRSTHPKQMGEDVRTSDMVLDVSQIRRWAPALGRHVTVVAVEDAMHDVVLSRPDVRKAVYDELDRWVSAYVD